VNHIGLNGNIHLQVHLLLQEGPSPQCGSFVPGGTVVVVVGDQQLDGHGDPPFRSQLGIRDLQLL
jgi:hypothetical protein